MTKRHRWFLSGPKEKAWVQKRLPCSRGMVVKATVSASKKGSSATATTVELLMGLMRSEIVSGRKEGEKVNGECRLCGAREGYGMGREQVMGAVVLFWNRRDQRWMWIGRKKKMKMMMMMMKVIYIPDYPG
ncbi:uncharacterized protein DS421_15g522200 [Arachis hypogaea]|nr:uncharacterized protein DS421_15g522200 [Arachis hypogaea]